MRGRRGQNVHVGIGRSDGLAGRPDWHHWLIWGATRARFRSLYAQGVDACLVGELWDGGPEFRIALDLLAGGRIETAPLEER